MLRLLLRIIVWVSSAGHVGLLLAHELILLLMRVELVLALEGWQCFTAINSTLVCGRLEAIVDACGTRLGRGLLLLVFHLQTVGVLLDQLHE